jgi:hypothetical protein
MVTDGGVLDQEGDVDSNVRDPIGLGISTVGAPNIGIGGMTRQ